MDEYQDLLRRLIALPEDVRVDVLMQADAQRRALKAQTQAARNLALSQPIARPVQDTQNGPEVMRKVRAQGARMGAALQDLLRG